MQFSVYQESHIGARKVNQDRMGYSYTRDALLLVLADGMGGHRHGEVAAQITLSTLSTLFALHATPYVKQPEHFLEQGLLQAHDAIYRNSASRGWPDTPRTTVVACLIQHNMATWAHCGDSRLYWMRGGQILARTRDHSHIENLIASGRVAPAARASHPDRNKIFNCLGGPDLPRVALSRRASMLPGDVMLLCSDGLWNVLPDAELAQRLQRHTIVRAVPEMLQAALAGAGPHSDNVTALAVMWQGSLVVDAAPSVADGRSSVMSAVASPADRPGGTRLAGSGPAPKDDVFGDAFDADIEKAIAEIRGAIEKSSRLLK